MVAPKLIEQKIIARISIRWLGEILHRYKVRLRRTKIGN